MGWPQRCMGGGGTSADRPGALTAPGAAREKRKGQIWRLKGEGVAVSFEPEPERGGRAGAVCVCMYPRGAEEMETDESRQGKSQWLE